MFWNRFYELCVSIGSKPNPVAKELGLSSGVLTKWKSGTSYPNGTILIDIAKYFNCSIDYLVGLTSKKEPYDREFSSADMEILKKLHSLPADSQNEIMHMVNYKYDQLQKKKKESLSPSISNEISNSYKNLA